MYDSNFVTECIYLFIIAGYNPPEGYVPTMINPMLQLDYNFDFDSLDGVNRFVVPYIACGDLRWAASVS